MAFSLSTLLILCSSILICAQYDILCCSIKNVRYTAMILKGNQFAKLRFIQSKINLSIDEDHHRYHSGTELLENLTKLMNDKTTRKYYKQ